MQSAIEAMRSQEVAVASYRGRRPLKRLHPVPQIIAEVVEVPAPAEPKEKPKPKEKEYHLKYFDYYCNLGQDRTLAQAAVFFNRQPQEMSKWSRTFGWVERAKEFDKKSDRDITRDIIRKELRELLRVAILRRMEMTELDPERPGSLRLTEKATIYAIDKTISLLHNAMKLLGDDVGIEKTQKEIDRGSPGAPGGKGGVMVNVFFKGLEEG